MRAKGKRWGRWVGMCACGAVLVWAGSALAIPALQLDIDPGIYVGGSDETTYATADAFTLFAYLDTKTTGRNPNDAELLAKWYYVSVALVRLGAPNAPVTSPNTTLGSFSWNLTPVAVTGDMIYGTPPLGDPDSAIFDAGDLSKHDIYDTYFTEFAFKFDPTKTRAAYNVQDGSADTGNNVYWMAFNLDVSGLSYLYALHFDLYNENRGTSDWDRDSFAPFSHDAQSGPGGDENNPPTENHNPVPEPGTMLLLGSGLLGLGGLARRKGTKG